MTDVRAAIRATRGSPNRPRMTAATGAMATPNSLGCGRIVGRPTRPARSVIGNAVAWRCGPSAAARHAKPSRASSISGSGESESTVSVPHGEVAWIVGASGIDRHSPHPGRGVRWPAMATISSPRSPAWRRARMSVTPRTGTPTARSGNAVVSTEGTADGAGDADAATSEAGAWALRRPDARTVAAGQPPDAGDDRRATIGMASAARTTPSGTTGRGQRGSRFDEHQHSGAQAGPSERSASRSGTLAAMAPVKPLNPDYERRSFWQASMPALPDRAERPLPDAADVVVIGGGYAGINAARELASRGVAVTLLEAHTLGWGASTRNGGIVHAGYKWSAPQLIKRYGRETGTELYAETLESYQLVKRLIAEHAIDCDFREVGHLELAYAPSHVPELEHARDGLATVGVASHMVPRDRIREEIGTDAYYGALVVEGSGLLHPGRYFAGLAAAAGRGRRRPARAGARHGHPAPGRRPVRGRDHARRDPGARRVRGHERLHGRGRAVAAPSDHGHRLVHHRQRAAAGGPGPRAVAARSVVLRHEELPVLLAHLGRPPDDLRRPGVVPADLDRQDRPDPVGGPARGAPQNWPTTASSTPGAATSGSPSTGCRTSGGPGTGSPTPWAAAARASP